MPELPDDQEPKPDELVGVDADEQPEVVPDRKLGPLKADEDE